MGMTGSGKSTFINLLAEDKDRVRVGHSLNSTTAEVQDHVYHMADGQVVRLLDTPGFDDTSRSDTDVLQTIANATNELYNRGRCVDGVIYMHPIIDPRMSGAALKSLGIFRRICGEKYFPHIALVSTKWESLKGMEARVAAESRQRDLIQNREFWGDLVDQGSVPFQHDGSVQSARHIVKRLLERSKGAFLKLQVEMGQGKTLAQTEAGSFVEGQVLKMKENYEIEVERLRREFKQVKVEGDQQEEQSVLEQTQAVQAKIFGLAQDAASLHVDSRELEQIKGSRRRRSFAAWGREEILSDDEELKIVKEIQELRDQKSDLECNVDDLREEEAALLMSNKYLKQEQEAHRRRMAAKSASLYVERRKPSPNEVQRSARHHKDEKRGNESTKNTERGARTSERGKLRARTSPISPPRSPRHSRVIDSDSVEWQEQPPARSIRRAQTVPVGSSFEPK
jgi:hypothetical protein